MWAAALGIVALLASTALADRSKDVVVAVGAANAGLSDADRKTKFEKMRTSPFVFFRGTAHLFDADHAKDERLKKYGGKRSTRTWIQGDLHPENFGAFHDDRGKVVYDLNDFDTARVDDYQLDLWRMGTGIALLARQNGLSKTDQEKALDAFSEAYLDTLAGYVGNKQEKKRQFTAENTKKPLRSFLEQVRKQETRVKMLDRWTRTVAGKRALDTSLAKLAPAPAAARQAIERALPGYTVKSVAKRLLAGTGSLGTARYYVLVEGKSDSQDDDLILDVKGQPSLADAQRVVKGHKALGVRVDDHLTAISLPMGAFSVRERSPQKEAFPLEKVTRGKTLRALAAQWGQILATAHARADKDHDEELVPHQLEGVVTRRTAARHKGFRRLVREVSLGYADQVEADHEAFTTWLAGGGHGLVGGLDTD